MQEFFGCRLFVCRVSFHSGEGTLRRAVLGMPRSGSRVLPVPAEAWRGCTVPGVPGEEHCVGASPSGPWRPGLEVLTTVQTKRDKRDMLPNHLSHVLDLVACFLRKTHRTSCEYLAVASRGNAKRMDMRDRILSLESPRLTNLREHTNLRKPGTTNHNTEKLDPAHSRLMLKAL